MMSAAEVCQRYEAGETCFQGLNLAGANFKGMNLAGVDLSQANLAGGEPELGHLD